MSIKERAIERADKAASKLSASVIGKALLDGGLDLIPGLGAAISSAIETRASKLFEENTQRFAEQLKSEVDRLAEEKLDLKFIESEEFVSLLVETLSRNSRTHEHEKTRLFARAFANFSTTEFSSYPYKEGFLEIIERLSVSHARAMALIYRRSQEPLEAGETRKIVDAGEISGTLGISRAHAEAYGEQLARYGLIKDARLGTFDYAPHQYEITNYGREFGAFLGEVAG